MGIKWTVTQEHLERLKEVSKKNKDGLSNFKLTDNQDGKDSYVFRVVCEKLGLGEVNNGH